MPFPWGAVIGGAVSGVTGLKGGKISSARQYELQQKASRADFAREQASRERSYEWMEHMSSTEIQRRMADLKAGGLNPILAYQGSASSPSGGAASSGSSGPVVAEPVGVGTKASSALAAVRNMEEMNKNLQEQNRVLVAQQANISANTAKTLVQTRREAAAADRAEVLTAPFRGIKGLPSLPEGQSFSDALIGTSKGVLERIGLALTGGASTARAYHRAGVPVRAGDAEKRRSKKIAAEERRKKSDTLVKNPKYKFK